MMSPAHEEHGHLVTTAHRVQRSCDPTRVTMAGMNWRNILTKAVADGLRAAITPATRRRGESGSTRLRRAAESGSRPGRSTSREQATTQAGRPVGSRYPGDFTGTARFEYAPDPNGQADPGEIVWAWVPYEEDHSRGKDRPVLAIGFHRERLLALMLTSKDHDSDARQEAREGRFWFDIGAGDWDAKRRPSEVRVDRILQLDPATVRREGGRLDRRRFDLVAAEVRRVHGW